MIYKKEFELAKKIAVEVGNYLNLQTIKKIDSNLGKDIKLELDKKSEKMIIDAICDGFDYPILSEEAGLTKDIEEGSLYWIVDPIDGTLNFSRDNPVCCISIALWIKNEPIFGVVYDFNRDELFCGYVNAGAWLNNKQIQNKNKVSKSQSILATGFPIYMNNDENTIREFIQQVQEYKKIRIIGSAALSLAYVSCGRFDAYIENNIKLWDIAAGVAINRAIGHSYQIEYLNEFEVNLKLGVI